MVVAPLLAAGARCRQICLPAHASREYAPVAAAGLAPCFVFRYALGLVMKPEREGRRLRACSIGFAAEISSLAEEWSLHLGSQATCAHGTCHDSGNGCDLPAALTPAMPGTLLGENTGDAELHDQTAALQAQ